MAGIRRAVGRDGWEGWATATVGGRRVRRHVRGRTRAEVTEAVRTAEEEWRNSASGGRAAWRGSGHGLGLVDVVYCRPNGVRSTEDPGGVPVGSEAHRQGYRGSAAGKLTPEHVEKLYAEMAERGRAAGTILHVRRTLSAALTTAVARGRVARNVVKLAVVPRDEPPEIEPLTLVEAQAIARVAADRRNGARWLVALALGLRQGEVLGLQWADVDWGAGTLSVRRALQRRPWRHGCPGTAPCGRRPQDCPLAVGGGLIAAPTKTRTSRRSLALPAPLAEALSVHRQAQTAERAQAGELWVEGNWVFATEIGTPIDPRNDLRE